MRIRYSLALAATFMLCWGLAPESPNIDVAQSDYDPRVDAAMVILESAARRAEDGDGDMAWTDSQLAREMLLESASPGAEAYCEFGKQLIIANSRTEVANRIDLFVGFQQLSVFVHGVLHSFRCITHRERDGRYIETCRQVMGLLTTALSNMATNDVCPGMTLQLKDQAE